MISADPSMTPSLFLPLSGGGKKMRPPFASPSKGEGGGGGQERGLGVRDRGGAAKRGAGRRVLDARYGIRAVAEQRPALGDTRQQIGAILEAAATDDAGRIARTRQGVKRGDQLAGIDRAVEQIDADMTGRRGKRVLIAKGIGDQRHKAGAPRGGGQRSARGGGDQHRGAPIH